MAGLVVELLTNGGGGGVDFGGGKALLARLGIAGGLLRILFPPLITSSDLLEIGFERAEPSSATLSLLSEGLDILTGDMGEGETVPGDSAELGDSKSLLYVLTMSGLGISLSLMSSRRLARATAAAVSASADTETTVAVVEDGCGEEEGGMAKESTELSPLIELAALLALISVSQMPLSLRSDDDEPEMAN